MDDGCDTNKEQCRKYTKRARNKHLLPFIYFSSFLRVFFFFLQFTAYTCTCGNLMDGVLCVCVFEREEKRIKLLLKK